MREKKGFLFVVSGPSGSGKTTLIKSLLKDKLLKDIFVRSVSFTTRPKRKNEKNQKDYFFIKEQQFKIMLKRKKIIEWTRYLNYYYGTSKDFVDEHLQSGKHIILCLDARGAKMIEDIYPKRTVTIFILPPKIEALRQRINLRAQGSGEKKFLSRLESAKKEIFCAKDYDYRVINDDFLTALKSLKDIIIKKINFNVKRSIL